MISCSRCRRLVCGTGFVFITCFIFFSQIFIISCGSGDGEPTGDHTVDHSEAGGIRFNLDWQTGSSQGSAARHPFDLVLNPDGTINCAQSGISKMFALVLDQEDDLIQDNGDGWDCVDHRGTIEQVPAGIERKLVVSGRDAAGTEICRGEATGITVVPGDATGIIRVVMSPVDPGPFTAPVVTTNAADPVTENSATVNGSVNPNGLSTSFHFEYGPTTDYGTSTTSEDAGAGGSAVSVHHAITGLAPETQYHYRIVATNSAGTTYGNDMMFSTDPATIIHTVTFSAGPNGRITGNTPQSVVAGEDCSEVEAIPDAHFEFDGWTGDYVGTNNPLTITNVTSNLNVTANFKPATYTVTFTAGPNGSLSGDTSQVVEYGGTTTAVEALPDANYRFDGWSGDYTGNANPLTFTNVTSDMSVTADFEGRDSFWITGTSPANTDADVRIDTPIEIVFNLNIDPDTIAGTTISVGTTAYTYTSYYHSGTYTLTLDPEIDFPTGSDITVELPATVTGYNEEIFTGSRTISFRTGTAWHDGNTVFVSPSGAAGNPGTKAQPLRSIQEAVDTAYDREYGQVYIQNGTYSYANGGLGISGNAGLHITAPVTIIGGWNAAFTSYSESYSTLDCENACDHVVFIQSSDVDMRYLTITGGHADGTEHPHDRGGGILMYNSVDQSNILIQNTEIRDNTAERGGSGIFIENCNSHITIQDSNISNNNAPNWPGGTVYVNAAQYLTFDDVYVNDNINDSQAFRLMHTDFLTITHSSFYANDATAIYLYGAEGVAISNSFINSDDVGIYLSRSSGSDDPFPNLSISDCSFASDNYTNPTATAVREGESNVHGHSFSNNRFFYGRLANLYQDSDGTTIPPNDTGLGVLNTSGHQDHDANPAHGNEIIFRPAQ